MLSVPSAVADGSLLSLGSLTHLLPQAVLTHSRVIQVFSGSLRQKTVAVNKPVALDLTVVAGLESRHA